MKFMPASLGGRLMAGLALFTIVASTVTLGVMDRILERFVTGQIDQRLDNKLVALGSQIRVAIDQTITIDGDADGPPFDVPRHRSFWWVGGPRNARETRWLVPGAFVPPTQAQIDAAPQPWRPPPPRDEQSSNPHPRTLRLQGPGGVPTYARVVVRRIGDVSVTLLAAAPIEAIAGPMREALKTLACAVILLGLVSILVGFSLVRLSLRPLTRLRREISDVRAGRSVALTDGQPIEVQPLAEELNKLLAQNAANLARARKHVANLAHGLKTPLATLSLGVARLEGEPRSSLQPLVDSIDRRVRHHLGRARAAASDGPLQIRTMVRVHLFDIVGALQKIYAEKQVAFALDSPGDISVACEPQDLDEILGNLLDNAFKYTRTRVTCTARIADATVAIDIADDGPGLRAEDIERVLRPGQRLDEHVPGFGFGLPIARELVELYGGELTLSPREEGLGVRLTLPSAL